jgi:hypothetical protein
MTDLQKKQIQDAALAVASLAEIIAPQTVIPVEFAKLGMAMWINYQAVAGLSANQIEQAFQSEFAKYLADDPNNIKLPG